jgi:hypothetical protein
VLLATLQDELDAAAAIRLDVLGGNPLRRAIDDDVDVAEQIIQRCGHLEPDAAHCVGMFRCCSKQAKSVSDHHVRTPVRDDVRHASQDYVRLLRHSRGDALTDHAVPLIPTRILFDSATVDLAYSPFVVASQPLIVASRRQHALAERLMHQTSPAKPAGASFRRSGAEPDRSATVVVQVVTSAGWPARDDAVMAAPLYGSVCARTCPRHAE